MERPMSRLALLMLIGLLATPAAAQESGGVQTVTIQLSNFKFSPSQITLQAGKPYRLHLQNTSTHSHNFAAPEFFAAASIRPEDQAKVDHGTVDLSGSQSVDVQLVAGRPGQYALRCTRFMHSTFGMTGAITVQ
jgi:uncharacterized cupredoxin-like copper-binding protein